MIFSPWTEHMLIISNLLANASGRLACDVGKTLEVNYKVIKIHILVLPEVNHIATKITK
jgi:hypothetical protein